MLDLVRVADGALLGSFPGDASLAVSFTPRGDKMFLGTSSRIYEWDLPGTRQELSAIGLDWSD